MNLVLAAILLGLALGLTLGVFWMLWQSDRQNRRPAPPLDLTHTYRLGDRNA